MSSHGFHASGTRSYPADPHYRGSHRTGKHKRQSVFTPRSLVTPILGLAVLALALLLPAHTHAPAHTRLLAGDAALVLKPATVAGEHQTSRAGEGTQASDAQNMRLQLIAAEDESRLDAAQAEARKDHRQALAAAAAAQQQAEQQQQQPQSPVPSTPAAPVSTSGVNWTAVAACESGGNWADNTGNGYYGGLQFSLATWDAYGGQQYAALPSDASEADQIAVANAVLAGQGIGAWPVCG